MPSPAALLGALPKVPDGATLYLLMNMQEMEPSPEAIASGLGPKWDKQPPDNCKDFFKAFQEAGGRVFLPAD
jgi:hypothetical protein